MTKEMTLQEQKDVALALLCKIDKICRENGFSYSLAYGTLLGAVRHGGFIPWDDDIDIMMPRSDYLKFVEYCKNNETEFELASNFTDPDYGYMFAKACDKDTVVIPGNMKWCKHGIWVDIFCIENLGNDIKTAKKRVGKKRFQNEMLVAWNWRRFEKNPYKSLVYNMAKLAFFLMSRFCSNKSLASSLNKYYDRFAEEKSAYMGVVCGGFRGREIMPAVLFDEYTDISFENEKFRTIVKYDEYLTDTYGDYMQPPPEDRRVSHHDFKAYRKDAE